MKYKICLLLCATLICFIILRPKPDVIQRPAGDFKTCDFVGGLAQKAALTKEESAEFEAFRKESAKTGHLGALHRPGVALRGSDKYHVIFEPNTLQTRALEGFDKSFAAGQTAQALEQIKGQNISLLHMFADNKFDYRLGICLLDQKAYAQATEYLERYAFYNNDSIEGWRAMKQASRLAGKSNNSPELELGFAKNEGVHFELGD